MTLKLLLSQPVVVGGKVGNMQVLDQWWWLS